MAFGLAAIPVGLLVTTANRIVLHGADAIISRRFLAFF